ncbi:ribosomal-protein-alanine N-acetyltransferase [Anaerosolibacter carboniphilus]|uniref:Ribosomal-protein-alanine N-acetyltransferase n=1 Tax=Anaerosolibacter carboniphilus TaxID=1417629 RepID=A0A841KXB6_9FIRM|nr:GNAT family protein [Anaerosolibacter carboniphilus]MBB6218003.1 ribosomal-protein-alanine N-acetyltransferase [Anaerosolibacter carboniphilus]
MNAKGINEFPELETSRLLLRKITSEDAKVLLNYWSDEDVIRYMNIESLTKIEFIHEMIDLLNNLYDNRQAIRWGIINKENNHLIGTCGYNSGLDENEHTGEIGYEIGKEYWGKGFMQEALKSVIDYGFQTMDLNRIEALVMLENIASIELLKKLGFKEEGVLREHGFYKNSFWDEYCFSLLKREWMI